MGLYDLVPEPRRIDYARMSREYPRVKGALTRAQKSGDPTKVVAAVERFIALSDDVGCMPDDWHRWRNALEDSWNAFMQSDEYDSLEGPAIADLVKRYQVCARRFA